MISFFLSLKFIIIMPNYPMSDRTIIFATQQISKLNLTKVWWCKLLSDKELIVINPKPETNLCHNHSPV